jgi:hypothetical protein
MEMSREVARDLRALKKQRAFWNARALTEV